MCNVFPAPVGVRDDSAERRGDPALLWLLVGQLPRGTRGTEGTALHVLTRAFADRYPSVSMVDLDGMERTAAALDARRGVVGTASLEEARSLAREADTLAANCGAQGSAWNRDVQTACAARERVACGDECCCVNVDTTHLLATPGVGSKAGQRERSFWERYRGRHR